ncbi:MAG: heavy metal-responsive transcriptional regulator, partial [Burkholderiales bacterium]|nr:heavy metal-responsive transcriptional regulator [Burkholderiales bacterium]
MSTLTKVTKGARVVPYIPRYYNRIGLLPLASDRGNDYVPVSASDRLRMRFVRRAQSLGYSPHEITQLLEAAARG